MSSYSGGLDFLSSTSVEQSEAKNKGNSLLFFYIEQRNHNMVAKVLQEDGANINAYSAGGECPIHISTRMGDTKMTEMLLTYRPNVNVLTRKHVGGLAALHIAARIPSIDIAVALVKANADVNMRSDPLQSTPLIEAAKMGRNTMVDFLLMKGADPNMKDTTGYTAVLWTKKGQYNDCIGLLPAEPQSFDAWAQLSSDPSYKDTIIAMRMNGMGGKKKKAKGGGGGKKKK